VYQHRGGVTTVVASARGGASQNDYDHGRFRGGENHMGGIRVQNGDTR